MAYRNNFYCIRNIIGYTGDLRYCPTVSFRRGHEYGRITQNHRLPHNIGREEVVLHAGYRMENRRLEDHKLHLVEWEGDEAVQVSRNAFVKRRWFRPGGARTLALAIVRFPDLKLRYVALQSQMQRTAQVQDESLAQFDAVRNNRLELSYRGVDRNPAATRVIDRVV